MNTLTREQILTEYDNGNIVYYTKDGPQINKINDLANKSAEDILKELSRTEKIILKMQEKNPESLKWVNDYALIKIVQEIKSICDNMSSEVVVESETTPEDVESMKKEIQKLNDAITAITEAKDTEINNINSRLEKAKEVFSIAKEEIAEKTTMLQKYSNDLEETIHNNERLANVNVEKDEKISELTNINEELTSKFEKAKEAYKELVNKNKETEEKIYSDRKKYEESIENLTVKLNEYKTEITKLIEEVNNSATQIKTLSKQNTELQAELNKPITLTIEKNPENNTRMIRMGDNLVNNFNAL